MLEQSGADFDERIVIVDIEYQRVLRYHQRVAGPRDDSHLREHLPLELPVGISHLTTDLRGMRRRINIPAYARNHALEAVLAHHRRDPPKLLPNPTAPERAPI